MRVLIISLGLLTGLAACKKGTEGSAAAIQALPVASEAEPVTTAPAPKAPPAPWFSGVWSGSYEVLKHKVKLEGKYGQEVAWLRDKGKKFVGAGQMSLQISAEGYAQGEALGALGEQRAQGSMGVQGLLLELSAKTDDNAGFFATVRCEETEQPPLECVLNAVSGDGKLVRRGTLVLSKGAASGTAKGAGAVKEEEPRE